MDVGAITNSSTDINSLMMNSVNNLNSKGNGYDPSNQTANYAKKGEPMYMADMDSDSDGVVSLDEFREYCKSKNISTRDMVKMSKLASAYRTMQAEDEAIDYISKLIPNVFPKLKQAENHSLHENQNDNKYNISSSENDKYVNYEDYMKYCEQNAVSEQFQTNAKAEESDNGTIKITHAGKAINSYRSSNATLKSTFAKTV